MVYICIGIVCVHIYTNIWALVLFWEGEVGHPQVNGKMHGLEIVPQCGGALAQATVMAFPLL